MSADWYVSFANHAVGVDHFPSEGPCNRICNFSRMCPILCTSPSNFPVRVSCHRRKNYEENVARLQ